MRVIAGTARRLPLKTVPGLTTRPTTDRIKETLFNILQTGIADSRFLDLFSGSGAIGIEALSRGAAFAAFIEKNPKAAACIRENLEFTRLADRAQVRKGSVEEILPVLREDPFDYVFMDPPYGQGLERKALEMIAQSPLVTEETVLIVEADLDTDFSYTEELGYQIVRRKEYKTNAHIFLKKK